MIGSVAAVLRCHLLRTATRKSGGESTLFARLDVLQNLRADTDSSAVHCLDRPAEDGSFPWRVDSIIQDRWLWGQTVIGEDGPEAETGTCNRQRRRVNIHTSTPSPRWGWGCG
jgi:hypothetical protein